MTPAVTGPDAMPMRMLMVEPALLAIARHGVEHVERHAREARRVVGHRLGQAGDDHVGVADGLDLLDAVALRQANRTPTTRRLSMSTVSLAPSRRARATKPEMSANSTEASSKLSAIERAGIGLQALDDGVGQNVAQHRVGLGLGLLGKAEGVVDGGRDEHEGGDRRLRVERVRHWLLATN